MSDSTLFFNGKIYLLDAADTAASSLLARDGKVAGLNLSPLESAALPPDVARVDLQGAAALPGLIDTHLHLPTLGDVAQAAFLFQARSVAEILEALSRQAARRPDGAVVGYGSNFRADLLDEGRLPAAAELDRVAADRPVLMFDVNKVIVNSFVLAQIPAPAAAAAGAADYRHGLFFGPARGLVPAECWKFPRDERVLEENIAAGLRICAAQGLTRIVNANVNLEQLRVLRRLNDQGRLPLKVQVLMFGVTPAELAAQGAAPGKVEGRLSFGPIKYFWDSFVMHKTAWMHAPYANEPGNYGAPRMPPAEFRKVLAADFDAGWPVAVHCTGDRALDELAGMLDAERSRMAGLPRSHIIHAYFPSPRAMEIFRRLAVGLAVQPGFMRCWGDTLFEFLGAERARRFLPLRSLLSSGVNIGGGSDAPINWPDARADIAAAIARRTAGGRILGDTENLSADEAVKIYTQGAARLAGWEDEAGSLAAGKCADLTVFDRDVRSSNADEIAASRILMTIVSGAPVYTGSQLPEAGGICG